jgi:glycosyl transferase family 25
MILIYVAALYAFLIIWRSEARRNEPLGELKPFDCFVINLAKRLDRFERFKQTFVRSDIGKSNLMRMEAVIGSELDIDTLSLSISARNELDQQQIKGFRQNHHELTPGAIGCYLSHVFTWEHILSKNQHEYVLICEDDCKIPAELGRDIAMCLRKLPRDWDILLCGALVLDRLKTSTRHFIKTKAFLLLHCYLIKVSAISKILSADIFPMNKQLDFVLSEFASRNLINVYTLPRNSYARQGGFVTDIQLPLQNARN